MKKLKICIEHVIELHRREDLDPEKIKYDIEKVINTPAFGDLLWGLGTYADAEVVSIKFEEEHDVRIS